MKSPPPLTTFLAERKWKSYSGVLRSVIGSSFPFPYSEQPHDFAVLVYVYACCSG